MDNKKIKSYIKETRIGLFYENAFTKEEEISDFKNILGCDFFFERNIINREIVINPNADTIKSSFDGYCFSSKDKMQKIFLQRKRFLFVDYSIYQSFDNLVSLYKKALSILNPDFFKNKSFKKLLFTTKNQIDCSFDKLDNIASFLPYLNLKEKGNNLNFFASMAAYEMQSIVIKNAKTQQEIVAKVNSSIPGLTENKIFPLSLVIETAADINQCDTNVILQKLESMRLFRNELFFANIGEGIKYEQL